MSEDATLDAFARERDDGGAVDAAPVTSSWREAGVCEACGEAADRRWLDDGERVCAACKRWS